MSMQTPHDIPLLITVPSAATDTTSFKPLLSAERRITPTWTISTLKAKLEPITGIPTTSQTLRTRSLTNTWITLSPEDALVGDARFGLTRGSEIEVLDGRGPGARAAIDFTDVGSVEKYVMPEDQYEKLDDSVMAWKKRRGLGRFANGGKEQGEVVEERREGDLKEVEKRGIKVGARCRVNESDERRGVVRFVGEIEGLGGAKEEGFVWVGIEFDEPVGRNDGTVDIVSVEEGEQRKVKRRVFECKGDKYGGLVRPTNAEVGDQWGIQDDLADLMDDDMEEI